MKKIILAIMLVLGFGLTNASAYENTPEGVILAYYKALVDKDIERAISYMSKKEFTRLDRRTKKMTDQREDKTRVELGGIYTYNVKDPKQWQFRVIKRTDFIQWKKEIQQVKIGKLTHTMIIGEVLVWLM